MLDPWVEMHQSLGLALLFSQNLHSFASTLTLEGLLVQGYLKVLSVISALVCAQII